MNCDTFTFDVFHILTLVKVDICRLHLYACDVSVAVARGIAASEARLVTTGVSLQYWSVYEAVLRLKFRVLWLTYALW